MTGFVLIISDSNTSTYTSYSPISNTDTSYRTMLDYSFYLGIYKYFENSINFISSPKWGKKHSEKAKVVSASILPLSEMTCNCLLYKARGPPILKN